MSTRMGFEPTRAEHIGLAVQRLNLSATSSAYEDLLTVCPYHPLSRDDYSAIMIMNNHGM